MCDAAKSGVRVLLSDVLAANVSAAFQIDFGQRSSFARQENTIINVSRWKYRMCNKRIGQKRSMTHTFVKMETAGLQGWGLGETAWNTNSEDYAHFPGEALCSHAQVEGRAPLA